MNYSNSILRNKYDSSQVLHYAKYFCEHGTEFQLSTNIEKISLYQRSDPNNALSKLTRDDQKVLANVTEKLAPFFQMDCPNLASSSERFVPGAYGIGAGSAVHLPILGWRQDYGVLRMNATVDGAPIVIAGRVFARGFGTHANSSIRLATTGLKRFRSIVGLDDDKKLSSYGSVRIRVLGDGRELYRSGLVTRATGPLTLDLPIVGVNELNLIAEDGGAGHGTDLKCDDHVSWADPMVE